MEHVVEFEDDEEDVLHDDPVFNLEDAIEQGSDTFGVTLLDSSLPATLIERTRTSFGTALGEGYGFYINTSMIQLII